MRRRSGVLVALFSLASSRSWGIGEFLDVPAFAGWLRRARQSVLQLLPILEIPEFETSPYSALTAMALDPIFIALPEVDDFIALGGSAALSDADRATLAAVQAAPRVQHRAVRALKTRWLRRCYDRFVRDEVRCRTPRAQRFAAFAEREAWWLDDYALFHALCALHAQRPWWEWPAPLAHADRDALARTGSEGAGEVNYRKYVQWIAAEQWDRARREAVPVKIFGDVPFMIAANSPDVWKRQGEFRFDATVGVPPDAFSERGQDWRLPPCRWDVMAASDFAWMRRRARRSAALFDGFRLDHLVGLYRTYIRPLADAEPPFFSPADEARQVELGERLVDVYRASGAEIVAEDLGVIPDFVRQSLHRLRVPGFKVFRWERSRSGDGQAFVDPADYDAVSVATTGTHDTETLAAWWDGLPQEHREAALGVRSVRSFVDAGYPPVAAIARAVLASGSNLAIIPMQDHFAWHDRINVPATVDEANWTWRLPWLVDWLLAADEPARTAERLAGWTREANRG